MSRLPLLLASNPPHDPADGVRAPRLDFLDLARAVGGEVISPRRGSLAGRWEERLAADWRQALAAARRQDARLYVSLSERVGIPLALFLGRRRRVPHVLVAHRLTSEKKRALQHRTGYLHRFDRVVVLCRQQEAYLRDEAGVPAERVHFVRHHIDAGFWQPSHPSRRIGDRLILSVGRERRDYTTLLTVARRLPDTRFVLVASSPWSRQPGFTINTVPPNVIVRQGLTFCGLRALYEQAGAVVVPLLPMTDYAAGANAVLEAMAMAKPLVVTATPGIVDYVTEGETALFVPPSDADALARAIEGTFAHPRLAVRRAANARQTAEARNTIEQYVAALARIIAEVSPP